MSTNNFFRSDLPGLNAVIQNSMILFPKEIIIATLREHFSHDTYYRFVKDEWGFPKTPDNTDLPLSAGLQDNLSTRIYIGESYRQDIIFYPAIIVRHGGASYQPISFNRERGTVQWDFETYEDGYGNLKKFRVPKSFIFAGAWDGTISIDVFTRSLVSRDHLTEYLSLVFTDIEQHNLEASGLFIKGVSAGAVTEQDDRNDKLYRQTITLTYRSEWRRHIPVGNVVEIVNFAIDFGRTDDPDYPVSPNLTINEELTMVEILSEL